MKHRLIASLVVVFLTGAISWAADDGAATFKAKCAGCHGASGEGKPAMKAPALKGTSLSDAQIDDLLTKGDAARKAPHSKAISGLTAEQAKAVAGYVKSLK